MKNKKILITGGAGFIGSNIIKLLYKNGNKISVLDNLSSGYLSNLEMYPSVNFIKGDIRDPYIVENASRQCEVIFHLAASVGNKRSIEEPVYDAEVNVIGTINVLNAAVKNNVSKIIVSSSAGIFGELKCLPINEFHPIDPDTPYGCTKLCEEKLSLAYSKLYPLQVICLRYFNVYGPNQRFDEYGNVIPKFVFKILMNDSITVYGDGTQTRDFVNVHDVAVANINAANSKSYSGSLNIASGTSITINELLEILSQIYNKRLNIIYSESRKGDVKYSVADIALAKKIIKYEPSINFRNGVYEYFIWAENFLKTVKKIKDVR